ILTVAQVRCDLKASIRQRPLLNAAACHRYLHAWVHQDNGRVIFEIIHRGVHGKISARIARRGFAASQERSRGGGHAKCYPDSLHIFCGVREVSLTKTTLSLLSAGTLMFTVLVKFATGWPLRSRNSTVAMC